MENNTIFKIYFDWAEDDSLLNEGERQEWTKVTIF